MPIEVDYSVKAEDLEQARAWIEETTGLTAEGRESSYWGGDYYAFYGSSGEQLKVFTNRDPCDGELIIGNSFECLFGLIVERAEPESPVLAALQRAPDKFEKMKENSY